MIFEGLFPSLYLLLMPENVNTQIFFNITFLYIGLWQNLFFYFTYSTYIFGYVALAGFITFIVGLIAKNNYILVIVNVIFFLLTYFLLVINNIIFFEYFYFIIVLTLYLVIIYVNIYIKSNNKLTITLQLIPLFGELFLLYHILNRITDRFILFKKIIFFTGLNILLIFSIVSQINIEKSLQNNNEIIAFGDFYIVNIDTAKNRIVSNDKSKKEIFAVDMKDNSKDARYSVICRGMFDGALYNSVRNEYYFYDEFSGSFFVLNDDFAVKYKKQIAPTTKDTYSGHRIVFDNEYGIIILILEKGKLYKLNIKTLDTMHSVNIPDRSDYAIINKFRKSCLISFWLKEKYLIEYSIDSNKINKIDAQMMQGYMQISDKNREIYLAYHQKGKIYVYDAQTYQLKRKIKTNYAVKNITYDEDLDILLAPSYIKGYVDIFLMDGSDKLIWHGFVGPMLRESKFDTKKENLFISSQYALYRIPINIKELIKFHVKQKRVKK